MLGSDVSSCHHREKDQQPPPQPGNRAGASWAPAPKAARNYREVPAKYSDTRLSSVRAGFADHKFDSAVRGLWRTTHQIRETPVVPTAPATALPAPGCADQSPHQQAVGSAGSPRRSATEKAALGLGVAPGIRPCDGLPSRLRQCRDAARMRAVNRPPGRVTYSAPRHLRADNLKSAGLRMASSPNSSVRPRFAICLSLVNWRPSPGAQP